MNVFLKAIKRKVAVIGLGKIGSSLTSTLEVNGYEVVASKLHPENREYIAS